MELLAYLKFLKSACVFLPWGFIFSQVPNKLLFSKDHCLPLCSLRTLLDSIPVSLLSLVREWLKSRSDSLSSSSVLMYNFCDVGYRKLTNFKTHKLNPGELSLTWEYKFAGDPLLPADSLSSHTYADWVSHQQLVRPPLSFSASQQIIFPIFLN